MTKSKTIPILLITILLCNSCDNKKEQLEQGEGFVEVSGGKIWYNIVGDGPGIPLLLLHGGPGFTSHYLNPMKELGADRPIIFIDQLGSGRSIIKMDTSIMEISNFVEQINEVKESLGLNEYVLYGHSWGTMLGIDYYTKYPEGIKALILASPLLSTEYWSRDAQRLIQQLPDTIQLAIQNAENQNAFDTPDFLQAMDAYYQSYVARKLPWDANMDSTFAQMNAEIYNYMWGPSEFKALGTLKNFDRLDAAKKINVPTLFMCGEFDEAQPETVKYYQSLVPKAEFKMIENAAHVLTHDNPEQHNQVVRTFLNQIEQSKTLISGSYIQPNS